MRLFDPNDFNINVALIDEWGGCFSYGALKDVLDEYEGMQPYIALVRYGRSQEVNDFFQPSVTPVSSGEEIIL